MVAQCGVQRVAVLKPELRERGDDGESDIEEYGPVGDVVAIVLEVASDEALGAGESREEGEDRPGEERVTFDPGFYYDLGVGFQLADVLDRRVGSLVLDSFEGLASTGSLSCVDSDILMIGDEPGVVRVGGRREAVVS